MKFHLIGNFPRLPLVVIAVVAAGLAGCAKTSSESVEAAAATSESAGPASKVILSDQAQKNLALTARWLKADVYWKTIMIQGIVVDRPGVSDQEVVAPTTGVITKVLHVPGDILREGEPLFTLKLTSDSVHQAQAELYKTTQEILLAQHRLARLVEAGDGVAQARLVDVRNEITRLEVASKSLRHGLQTCGFSTAEIDGVSHGNLVSELQVFVPGANSTKAASSVPIVSTSTPLGSMAPTSTLELQQLHVEVGQHVDAGDTLCSLSNHRLLAIEGRAFRDETLLLEHSVQQGWPVEVDFQEDAAGNWPEIKQAFFIQHVANTIDTATRTFAFRLPLENQSKTIDQAGKQQLLWRYRPGQRVRLLVRVEKLDNVFVLPADAVVREGAEAFVFTQNVNTFERKGVHSLLRDRDRVVIANDGALPTYLKQGDTWTIAAVVRNAAAQLNRMTKAGSSGAPPGYHVHADGSLHKNEDEGQ